MQNAQMHQILMQNMMLKALPPGTTGPRAPTLQVGLGVEIQPIAAGVGVGVVVGAPEDLCKGFSGLWVYDEGNVLQSCKRNR